jgi:hypothetical protein
MESENLVMEVWYPDKRPRSMMARENAGNAETRMVVIDRMRPRRHRYRMQAQCRPVDVGLWIECRIHNSIKNRSGSQHE